MDVRTFAAPSLTLFGVEFLRAAFEYAGMRCMDSARLPSGDGHPVVIFPGLATDKTATGPLKQFLDGLGYTAYDWGRGFNTGPRGDPDSWLDELADHVGALTGAHRERVSFVGWSLGGHLRAGAGQEAPGAGASRRDHRHSLVRRARAHQRRLGLPPGQRPSSAAR
jgi:hypothetical protein